MKHKIKIFVLVAILRLVPLTAYSADEQLPGVDLTIQGVYGIITGLVCWFSRFALIAMVIAVIVYGMQFMTSRANPEKFAKAKKSLTWGLVGIIVILGTYTIIATVANAINPSATYSNFMPINCSGY